MIYDPGAAALVTGTQTIIDYARACLWPTGRSFGRIERQVASYMWIDGHGMQSGAHIRLPVDLGPLCSNFETDTIGDSGDTMDYSSCAATTAPFMDFASF